MIPDADQQLMQCCEWLRQQGTPAAAAALYSAMRPPTPPLQQAMETLVVLEQLHGPSQPLTDMRNALEDLEKLLLRFAQPLGGVGTLELEARAPIFNSQAVTSSSIQATATIPSSAPPTLISSAADANLPAGRCTRDTGLLGTL